MLKKVFGDVSLRIPTPYGVAAVAIDLKCNDFANTTISEAVNVLATAHSSDTQHTVLILDEANLFLQCTGDKKAARGREVQLIDALVKATKQDTLMSVVLVSSDEGLPFQLGTRPDHISKCVVISELNPRETRDLLQNELGVGAHLTNALMDCYGGHVFQMCKLLQELPRVYDREESEINLFMMPKDSITRALSAWSAGGGDEVVILRILEELARTGFVPASRGNVLAKVLTDHNVCAFLMEGAVEYQVPKELRAKRTGIIPDSQLLRVLIADMLEVS